MECLKLVELVFCSIFCCNLKSAVNYLSLKAGGLQGAGGLGGTGLLFLLEEKTMSARDGILKECKEFKE